MPAGRRNLARSKNRTRRSMAYRVPISGKRLAPLRSCHARGREEAGGRGADRVVARRLAVPGGGAGSHAPALAGSGGGRLPGGRRGGDHAAAPDGLDGRRGDERGRGARSRAWRALRPRGLRRLHAGWRWAGRLLCGDHAAAGPDQPVPLHHRERGRCGALALPGQDPRPRPREAVHGPGTPARPDQSHRLTRPLVAALLLFLTLAGPALAGPPTDQLRAYTDRVVRILEDPALDQAQRRTEIRAIALEAFDV